MIRHLKIFWKAILHGTAEGSITHRGTPLDTQERARQRLLRHVNDQLHTDKEVYSEFLQYCYTYDRELRLTRTNAVLQVMLHQRPAIKDMLSKPQAASPHHSDA